MLCASNRNSERGSAILWILIAVGLLAALSYAMMSGGGTSTSLLTDEQARTYARQIISFSNDVRQAAKRLQLRGCEDDEISFENTVYQTTASAPLQPDGHNPNAPANNSCDVFNVAGGALQPLILPSQATQPISGSSWNAGNFALMLGDSNNNAVNDLVLMVNEIDARVCTSINDILDIENPSDDAPLEADNDPNFNILFTGDYDSVAGPLYGDEATEISGRKSFCYKRDGTGLLDGSYIYAAVLIQR